MCGIVGFAGHSLAEEDLRRAVGALHHRGPDGEGIFVSQDGTLGLAHSRLSVVDLKTGAQPLYSEKRDLILVCNGEFYEYEHIRHALEAKGHIFSTQSDSELVLHLYQEYGQHFVDHLRGEYAFLLYDVRQNLLLAVRDRFGIKPLFVNKQNGKYLFASEAKALFATRRVKPRLNVAALRDYLSWVVPDCIFEGIESVPPGCLVRVNLFDGSHEIHRYWELDLRDDGVRADDPHITDVLTLVRQTVDEAIRLRLRADAPLGVYLSGGLDSAIVAATVARYRSEPLKVFCISFPDDPAFDEIQSARRMAEHIGAELHVVRCDLESLVGALEDFLWVVELPFVNLHGVGKFMLSALAQRHVKVVLTGEGADELFLGYENFAQGKGSIADRVASRKSSPGDVATDNAAAVIDELGFLPMREYARSFSKGFQRLLARMFARPHRGQLAATHPMQRLKRYLNRDRTEGLSFVRQLQHFSFTAVLAPYILTVLGDRGEMAHSIEGRQPFLDQYLFDEARRLPDRLKIKDGTNKYVLREAFKDRITREVYEREKWPYLAPSLMVKKGRSAALDHLIQKYLSKQALQRSGIFDPRAIRCMRALRNVLPDENRLTRAVDLVLCFVLTVQILDWQYVQHFDDALQARALAK